MTSRAYFAGVGARVTPDDVCALFTRVARHLARHGFGLRSGGSGNADLAFERGIDPKRAQILLPWRGFNGHASYWHDPGEASLREASLHHPAWHACSRSARLLHARNCQIVLGPDLRSPSVAVVCWTSDGRDSGGTGHAIRVARAWRVPVFNARNHEDRVRLRRYLVGPPSPRCAYEEPYLGERR